MIKTQECHRQLTVKAGDQPEEVTVMAVLAVCECIGFVIFLLFLLVAFSIA